MNQPLDLCITFSPPPPGSPAGSIANIVLHCDSLSMSSAGELLTDPLPEGARADLRWYLEEYWKWPYEQFLERGKRVEMLLPELGKRLYKAVLGSDQAKEIVRQWWSFAVADRQISIVSNIPAILSLP